MGGNRAGYLLAKTLVEQGCHVIIIDKFNPETKKYITELKKFKSIDFFEFKGIESVYKNLKRFDYLFYLLNEGLVQNDFDSKEFLKETGFVDLSLKNAKKKRLNIIPKEYGLNEIGHLDFFREKNKTEIWHIPLDYIEE